MCITALWILSHASIISQTKHQQHRKEKKFFFPGMTDSYHALSGEVIQVVKTVKKEGMAHSYLQKVEEE